MKNILCIAALITLFTMISFGQAETRQAPQSDEEIIKNLELEYAAAFVKADWDTLDRLVAEEYTLLDEKGQMKPDTKASVLRGLRATENKFLSNEVSGLEISVTGDTATVRGSMVREFQNQKTGARGFIDGKYLRTWKRKDNQWRIVSYQPIVKETLAVKPKRPDSASEPVIASVSAQEIKELVTAVYFPIYSTSIRLTIYGRNLGGGGALIYVNGKDVSRYITQQNHSYIILEDSQKALNLSGKTVNTIELTVNGKKANSYSFSQRF